LKTRKNPLWLLVLGYMVCWVPFIALTRSITSVTPGGMTRPLTGLEILPFTNIAVCILIYAFFAATGWWRSANQVRILGVTLPMPAPLTALAGFGSALLVITVPLSLTFPGVSIPFIQFERSASVLGGIIATYALAWQHGLPQPTVAELIGVALLVAAIVVLSFGPKFDRRQQSTAGAAAAAGTGETR
jgi:hypothetical protein